MGILGSEAEEPIDLSQVDDDHTNPRRQYTCEPYLSIIANCEAVVNQEHRSSFLCDDHDPIRARAAAEERLIGEQKRQWFAWKRGLTLPSLNQETDVGTAPRNSTKLKLYRARALALGILYRKPGYSVENVVFFVEKYVKLVPLLRAATKIWKAERGLDFGETSMSVPELVEYLMCQQVLIDLGGS